MRLSAFVLALLIFNTFCYGGAIPLSDSSTILVTNNLYYLSDKNENLKFSDFSGLETNKDFKPVDHNSWVEDTEIYWLKFEVKNPTDFDGEWVFEFDNWAYVDFYYKEGSQFIQKKTGHLYPFSKRDYPIANKNYIKILIRRGEEKECLVRLESRLFIGTIPQNLYFKVAPRSLIDEEDSQASKIIFAFLGAFVIIFLYNFFIFLTTRLESYAYYLLSLLFVIYNTVGNSGYIMYLSGQIDSFPVWFFNFELISSNLWGITYILFVRSFLKVKERYPFWDKVLKVLLILYVISSILVLTYFEAGFYITQIVGLISILVALTLGIKSVLDHYPSAIYFLLGNSALLTGITIVILMLSGVLPANRFTVDYALPLGSTVEILLFSVALANLINILRKENEEKQVQIIEQLNENQELQSRANKELEQKVHERTKELELSLSNLQKTQNQLVQKEKMASLGELTAGIAHEIQNPLNFVNNYSEVSQELLEEFVEEQQKEESERDKNLENEILENLDENLKKINMHGMRANAIVKSMMQFSRRTTGDKVPSYFNNLTAEYLKIAYSGFRANNPLFKVKLVTDYDPKIEKVELVSLNIGRVLLNIFNNAFYAVQQKAETEENTFQPRVIVSTRLLNDSVELRIRDNGTGISEDVLSKIFQPFFTTKPTGLGTGMGLSLSYDIITNEHGGEITVETEVGNYTEFVIRLPHQEKPLLSDKGNI